MKRILTKDQAQLLRAACKELKGAHPDWDLTHVLSEGMNRTGLEGTIKVNTSAARRYVGMKNGDQPRKYKPRRKAVAPVVESEVTLNYCPCCGFNIGMFRAAAQVAMKHS